MTPGPADRQDPDADLMRRLQGGDEGAFAELVGRHQQRVWNIAARFVGRTTDCEDLAQEIFLRVWRARARWRPEAKVTTWLYQIAANLCLNFIRDRKRRPATSLDAGDGEGPGHDPADARTIGPDAAASGAERAARVRAAIGRLPENQRLAVVLFRQEGLSYVEVAKAMSLSLPAVKSLLNRAKENLREALLELLPGEFGAGTPGDAEG